MPLWHSKLESKVRYLGIEGDEALIRYGARCSGPSLQAALGRPSPPNERVRQLWRDGADVELQECSSQSFFKRLAHRRNPLPVNHQALGNAVRSD